MGMECGVMNRNGDEMLISTSEPLNLYEKVFDERNRPIGKVVRVLGPTSFPMAVLKLYDPRNTPQDIRSVYVR